MTLANITTNINSIPILNGSHLKSWQENLLKVLTVIDLDLALRFDSLPPLTDESILNDKRDIEISEKSNHMYIMIMKKSILDAVRGFMTKKITKTKEFLVVIENRFVKSKKAKVCTLLTSLILIRYMSSSKKRKKNEEVAYTTP